MPESRVIYRRPTDRPTRQRATGRSWWLAVAPEQFGAAARQRHEEMQADYVWRRPTIGISAADSNR